METCGMSVIKYLLFAFNLVFAISGIGIIAAGAVVLVNMNDYNHFMESGIIAPPIVLIVAGVIIFFIAFLGCFGAIRESYSLLMAFAVLLVIIFIIELAVGIAAAVYKNDFEDAMRKCLKESMANYSKDTSEKYAWDNAHSKLKCCGIDGSSDWSTVPAGTPQSCCKPSADGLTNNCSAGYYQDGCFSKLKKMVHDSSSVLLGVGIGIAFVQIVGIILACILGHTIKRGEKSG